MSYNDGRKASFNELALAGRTTSINSQDVVVDERDGSGNVVRCHGTVTITDAGSGYAVGCQYRKTDGAVATTYFINEGTSSSCDFNAMETAASSVTSVTAGTGLTGGGTEGALTLNAIGGRGIEVRANNIDAGVPVYNTLGALGIGVLVNLSGFNTTLGVTMTKADADAGIQATHVTLDAIADTTAGVVYPLGTAVGDATNNLNTNGQTIGDLVYLSGTAGGFVFAALTGADQLSQAVGVVKVVSATVGEIVFFPGAARILKLPTSQIQALAVGTSQLAANAVTTAKLDEKTIQYAEVSLTKTNILALNSTPIQLVAAAAGKAYEFISAVVIHDRDTAAYTGGGDITVRNAVPTTLSSTISAANSFGSAADSIMQCVALDTANGIALAENSALQITCATGDFTDPGTAAGVGRIKVAYRTHTTGL